MSEKSSPSKLLGDKKVNGELRLLPSSDIAEVALLGSFLRSPQKVGALCAERGVTLQAFHFPENAIVFGVMSDLWDGGTEINYLSVSQRVRDLAQAQALDADGILKHAILSYPTAANAEQEIETLLEKQALRGVIAKSEELVERAYKEQHDVAGILESFSLGAVELSAGRRKSNAKTTKQLVIEKLERIETGEPRKDIISVGLEKLDKESPVQRGSMTVIAGEAKSGKSILATTITSHILQSHPVLYFNLEDPAEALIDRLTASMARVPIAHQHASEGKLSERDISAMNLALNKLHGWNLFIRDDVHDLTGIVGVCRQVKAQYPDLGAVFVDYGQLVRAQVRKQDTREAEVAAVSRTLRLLGLELHCAMFVLSQLNKDGDTRESTSLEKDCTALWKVMADENDRNIRWIAIPFQRNGDCPINFKTTFFGHICRFENYAGRDQDEQMPEKKPQRKKR